MYHGSTTTLIISVPSELMEYSKAQHQVASIRRNIFDLSVAKSQTALRLQNTTRFCNNFHQQMLVFEGETQGNVVN